MSLSDFSLLGNSPLQWAGGAVVFLLTALLCRLTLKLALLRLTPLIDRTSNRLDDLVAEMLRKTKTLFVLLVAFWAGSEAVALSPVVERGIESLLIIGLIVQTAFWAAALVSYGIDQYRARQLQVDPSGATAIGALSFMGRALVWAVALLLVLDNLGIDVTALITGLGIGGVAVALALQNVLADLFASLSIVLDKPFVVGDFVVVGDFMGTIEHVGLKTTRIRSLSGEQLVFSNSDLLGSRIRNYRRMSERRVVFEIGVTYDTPTSRVQAIPGIVREAIEEQPQTRFDRSHFRAYGPSSLDFETVYYVLSPDYNAYMDIQQAINLTLLDRFRAEGIDFAYPTQTVFAHFAGRDVELVGGAGARTEARPASV